MFGYLCILGFVGCSCVVLLFTLWVVGNLGDVVDNLFRFVGLFAASVCKAVDGFACEVLRSDKVLVVEFCGRWPEGLDIGDDSRCFGAEGFVALAGFGI